MSRPLSRIFVQCLAVIVMSLAAACTAHAQLDRVTFNISDFGINQWDPHLTIGGDLSRAKNTLFDTKDPNVVGIAVPMALGEELETMLSPELRAHIADKVQASVEAAYAKGVRNFEIQVIQNIDTAGYRKSDRQKLVNAFGSTAYAAIGDVITRIEGQGVAVNSYAIAGSNGASVLAASVASLRRNGGTYLDGVDLIDGRAHIEATSRLIEAVGARYMRIFNTRGDLPAPHAPLGFKSIANFSTAIDLKDKYHELKTYLLTPVWQRINLSENHIVSMRKRSSTFRVEQYIGNGYIQRVGSGNVSGLDLRRQPVQVIAAGSADAHGNDAVSATKPLLWVSTLGQQAARATPKVAPPYAAAEFVRVNADRIGDFAAVAFAYANVLDAAHLEALKKIDFFRNEKLSKKEKQFLKSGELVASVFSVARAVEQDRAENTFGAHTFLRSRTLEAIGQFGLDMIDMMGLENNSRISGSLGGVLGQVGGYQSLLTGLAKHAGSGKFDADIADLYVDGIKSLYKARLKRANALHGSFALVDGFQELAIAGFRQANGRRLDVGLVTNYVDAVNNLAWTGLGLSVCTGNYACTKSIQVFGTTLAKALRHASEPLFSVAVLAKRGQGGQVIDDYMTIQQRRIANGQKVQPISEIYTRDLLKSNGISARQIDELDAAATHAARGMVAYVSSGVGTLAPVPSPTVRATAQPIAEDVGGVTLDTGTPRIVETDLSATRRTIIDGRP